MVQMETQVTQTVSKVSQVKVDGKEKVIGYSPKYPRLSGKCPKSWWLVPFHSSLVVINFYIIAVGHATVYELLL